MDALAKISVGRNVINALTIVCFAAVTNDANKNVMKFVA
jgi:hypothetical protein